MHAKDAAEDRKPEETSMTKTRQTGDFPVDFVIPDEWLKRLRISADDVELKFEKMLTSVDDPLWINGDRFKERFSIVRKSRLFIDPSKSSSPQNPGLEEIIRMQARIAWQAFGWRYDKTKKGWTHDASADTQVQASSKGKGYLDRLVYGGGANNNMKKDEARLIGYSFGLPFWVWNIESDETFSKLMEKEAERRKDEKTDKLLIDFEPFDVFEEISEETSQIEIYVGEEAAGAANMRAFSNAVTIAHRAAASRVTGSRPVIPAKENLWFRFNLLDGEKECLLFERDDRQNITLISSSGYVGGEVKSVEAFEVPVNPNQEFSLQSSTSDLFLITANPGVGLEKTMAFKNSEKWSNEDEHPSLTELEKLDLRSRLLRTRSEKWTVFRQPLKISEKMQS